MFLLKYNTWKKIVEMSQKQFITTNLMINKCQSLVQNLKMYLNGTLA